MAQVKICQNISTASDFIGKPYLLSNSSLRSVDWSKSFSLLDNLPQNVTENNVETVYASVENREFVFRVNKLLDKEECQAITEKCRSKEAQSIKFGGKRNNSRLIIFDKVFSFYLWKKLVNSLKSYVDESNLKLYPLGFDVLRGDWELDGINEAIRFNSYNSYGKEKFEKHRDAQFCPSGDHRSFLSLVIYLNDDFKGGQTKFYIPKQHDCSKEIDIAGADWRRNFNKISVEPNIGSAVIFSQNIIHESVTIKSSKKYILKTDIMLKRTTPLGFQVCDVEKEDYYQCLNFFREAQQLELDNCSTKNNAINELYEKCLAIRYSYPAKALLRQSEEMKNDAFVNGNFSSKSNAKSTPGEAADFLKKEENFQGHLNNSQQSNDFQDSSILPANAFCIFPSEIWEKVFRCLCGDIVVEHLVNFFPMLDQIKKKVEEDFIIPKLEYNSGIFTCVSFESSSFVKLHLGECCRVLSAYSVYLLGHSSSSKTYTVKYDPKSNETVAIPLKKFLLDVFYKQKCYGAVYKVRQQDENKKEPLHDFSFSVTRDFMVTKYQKDVIGIDLNSDFLTEVKKNGGNNSESDGDSTDEDTNSDIDSEKADDDSDISDENSVDNKDINFENDSEKESKTEKCVYDGFSDNHEAVSFLDRLYQAVESYKSTKYKLAKGNVKTNNLNDDSESHDSDLDEYDSEEDEEERIYIDDAMNFINAEDYRKVLKGNLNLPGAAVVRKLEEKTKVSDICVCGIGEFHIDPKVSTSFETITFNHLIADFSKQEFKVTKVEYDDAEYDIAHYLRARVSKDLKGVKMTTEFKNAFLVDITALANEDTAFNHASCQCLFPNFELNGCIGLQSYPLLSKVEVVFVEVKNKVFAWTWYGGIVAL